MPSVDTVREALVCVALMSLCHHASKKQSYLIMVMCLGMIGIHILGIYDYHILDEKSVATGATLFCVQGFHLHSKVISFAGMYSILSKYNYTKNGLWHELLKLFISLGVWTIVWYFRLWYLKRLKRQTFLFTSKASILGH